MFHTHDALPLPRRPSLSQYKKLAKDLLKGRRSNDPTAIRNWAADWIASLSSLSSSSLSSVARKKSSVIPSEVAASRSEAVT